jgi:hypothetical protein
MNKILTGYQMNRTTLRPNPKRQFDPKNPEDITEYKRFLKNGGWKGVCPFELEWPYTSVPHMIADKISTYYVNKVFKAK